MRSTLKTFLADRAGQLRFLPTLSLLSCGLACGPLLLAPIARHVAWRSSSRVACSLAAYSEAAFLTPFPLKRAFITNACQCHETRSAVFIIFAIGIPLRACALEKILSGQPALQTGGDRRPQNSRTRAGELLCSAVSGSDFSLASTRRSDVAVIFLISASRQREVAKRWSVSERRDAKVICLCACRPHFSRRSSRHIQ